MYSFDYLNQNGVSFNNVYLRRKRQGWEKMGTYYYQTYYMYYNDAHAVHYINNARPLGSVLFVHNARP